MIFNFSAKNAHKIFLVAGNLRESTIANWIESSPKKKCAILFVDVFLLIWIILQFIYRSGKKKLKLFLRPSPSTARKREGERERVLFYGSLSSSSSIFYLQNMKFLIFVFQPKPSCAILFLFIFISCIKTLLSLLFLYDLCFVSTWCTKGKLR